MNLGFIDFAVIFVYLLAWTSVVYNDLIVPQYLKQNDIEVDHDTLEVFPLRPDIGEVTP